MDREKIKVLVITLNTWNINNVTGSTMSSIFEGMDSLEIANLYLSEGQPDNTIVSRYFQISEAKIIKALKTKSKAGEEIFPKSNIEEEQFFSNGSKLKSFIYNHKLQVFYWGQELLWKTGVWKSKELDNFIKDFNPDILWVPVFYNQFCNDVAIYVKKLCNKPMFCYISDDNYTLKQFNLSPFYWFNRFMVRGKIRKLMHKCDKLFVITDIQKREYDQIFNQDSIILTKTDNFDNEPSFKQDITYPIQLTFLGGLGFNRYKSLSLLAKQLNDFNKKQNKDIFRLDIYSTAIINDKRKQSLVYDGTSYFNGSLPSDKIKEVYSKSDILVHVEPMDLKNSLYYRHSLSTKIVDCIKACRPILAFGGNTGTINTLKDNKLGLVANNVKELNELLNSIYDNPQQLEVIASKSYRYGKRHFNKKDQLEMLISEFKNTKINS